MERGFWILLATVGLTFAAGCDMMQGGATNTSPLMDEGEFADDEEDTNQGAIGN